MRGEKNNEATKAMFHQFNSLGGQFYIGFWTIFLNIKDVLLWYANNAESVSCEVMQRRLTVAREAKGLCESLAWGHHGSAPLAWQHIVGRINIFSHQRRNFKSRKCATWQMLIVGEVWAVLAEELQLQK